MKSIDRTYVENQTKKDAIHLLLTGSTSLVPIVGDIIKFIFEDPAMKRRDDWIQSLAERIQKLEENNIKIEDLKDNENFISAVFYASIIAVKTHSKEKHAILLNALTNTALITSADETKQIIFLNLINEFTELHILLLRFFRNPEFYIKSIYNNQSPQFFSSITSSYLNLFLKQNDKLNITNEIIFLLTNFLHSNGLISIDSQSISNSLTLNGLKEKRTTTLGDEFIDFIKNPFK